MKIYELHMTTDKKIKFFWSEYFKEIIFSIKHGNSYLLPADPIRYTNYWPTNEQRIMASIAWMSFIDLIGKDVIEC